MDELSGVSEEQNEVTWTEVFKRELAKHRSKPLVSVTIKCPFLGCVFSFCLSHFSGNDLPWNILHGIMSWFYAAYRFAEYASRALQ